MLCEAPITIGHLVFSTWQSSNKILKYGCPIPTPPTEDFKYVQFYISPNFVNQIIYF